MAYYDEITLIRLGLGRWRGPGQGAPAPSAEQAEREALDRLRPCGKRPRNAEVESGEGGD